MDEYHYVCFDCGHEWESEHSLDWYDIVSDENYCCPVCESDNIDDGE